MECMFADSSKTPRFIFTKAGALKELTPDMKLESKTPTDGSFTVESDRAIMRVLSLVANSITTRIDRGATMSVLVGREGAIEKSADEVKEEPRPPELSATRQDSRIA